ncbi:MAG: DUF6580 family putative transport protein [Acidobacteriota bacterium]
MPAFLVLLAAALSRFLPHTFHAAGINFTAVGAGLLFFGARRPRWQAVIAMAVMAITDVILTTRVYGYEFKPSHYFITWAWYALVCLAGSALLRKTSFLRVAAGVLASATSFFLLSNFAVWMFSVMYPHTAAGLGVCYAAGLPFYFNDLASTSIVAGALFGLPVAAAKLTEVLQSFQHNQTPLA